MINQFIRSNKVVAGILAIIRVYLGYTWLSSGLGKLIGGEFNASGFLQGAIASASGENPAVQGWWAAFLQHIALPNATIFSNLVMIGEVLVGAALILGLFTNFAALMGIVMNFSFLLSGTVSTNVQMVILTIFIIIAGKNAGRYGLDRWVTPFINRKLMKREHSSNKTVGTAH